MSVKPRYDWYQTESQVVINILVRQLKPEQVTVAIEEKRVEAELKPDNCDPQRLCLDLSLPIKAQASTWKLTPSKVEVKLEKADARRWEHLEASTCTEAKVDVKSYPSSKPQKADWSQVEREVKKEEEEEKLDGDAGVNKLFQQIYANADEDTQRAMQKSFVESAGTVLSTNWADVGKGKVEMKPPEGMEYKKYSS